MRRASHRVFGNASARREESGDEIAVVTWRRGDDAQTIETHERSHVRLEASDRLLRLKHGEIVAGFGGGGRGGTKSLAQLLRGVARGSGAGWKVERQEVFVAGYSERAGTCLKTDDGSAIAKMAKDNVGWRKGRVAAQINFEQWGEPAKVEERIALNHESRLRKVVLGGD